MPDITVDKLDREQAQLLAEKINAAARNAKLNGPASPEKVAQMLNDLEDRWVKTDEDAAVATGYRRGLPR